jgi:hypothetical protein
MKNNNSRMNVRLFLERFLIFIPFFIFFIIILPSCEQATQPTSPPVEEETAVVEFVETDSLLYNPHRGFQTEGRALSQESELADYGIPSSSIYRRFYWYQLEPDSGVYDFSAIDHLLDAGEKEGQRFSFRVMCIASPGDTRDVTPKWFQNTKCNHWYLNNANYIPDMDDQIFKDNLYGLIKRLGEEYADDPRVDMVDIGVVGLWGEWHNGDDTDFPLPSPATRKEIVNLFFDTFPDQYKIINIESYEEDILQYAVGKGSGVRTDGMGDIWHHTYFFPTNYAKVPDAWKHAPIEGEAFGIINDWDDESWRGGGKNYGLTETIDDAIARHYSFFNWQHGSWIANDEMLKEVKRFERNLGYRIVLKKVSYSKEVVITNKLSVTTQMKNVGCAPPYWDYYLSFLLKDENGNEYKLITDKSIKGWLPGDKEISNSLSLPSNISAGNYTLYVGFTDPVSKKAAIQLAVDCERVNNWYKIGDLTIAD